MTKTYTCDRCRVADSQVLHNSASGINLHEPGMCPVMVAMPPASSPAHDPLTCICCQHRRLPDVLLDVTGDVFHARSMPGSAPSWSIRAKTETEESARTTISVDSMVVADVTIHALHESTLPDEVQAVAAAILWSALRAMALRGEQ